MDLSRRNEEAAALVAGSLVGAQGARLKLGERKLGAASERPGVSFSLAKRSGDDDDEMKTNTIISDGGGSKLRPRLAGGGAIEPLQASENVLHSASAPPSGSLGKMTSRDGGDGGFRGLESHKNHQERPRARARRPAGAENNWAIDDEARILLAARQNSGAGQNEPSPRRLVGHLSSATTTKTPTTPSPLPSPLPLPLPPKTTKTTTVTSGHLGTRQLSSGSKRLAHGLLLLLALVLLPLLAPNSRSLVNGKLRNNRY